MGRELDPRSGKLKEAHDNAETVVVSRYSDEKKVNYKRHAYETWKKVEKFSKQAKEQKNRRAW